MTATRPAHLCVALTHSLHVRNFVASGCLEEIARHGHSLTLIVPDFARDDVLREVAGWPCMPGMERLEPLLAGPGRRRLRAWGHTASFVHRRRWRTYAHKLRMSVKLTSPLFAARVGLLALADRWCDVERLGQRAERWLRPRRSALATLGRLRPDVLFAPTLVHDGSEVELVKAAHHLGIPTVGFAASWDTLTSKGAFAVPPDWLLVWGEENRRQAVEHHGFSPSRVLATGAPHFDVYGDGSAAEPRAAFLARRGVDPHKRVLLFAGTTVTYWEDEPRLLRALSTAIAQGELKDWLIWYRPHPRRPLREVADVAGLPHVVLDDQMARHKAEGASAYSARREDLRHYRSLMESVEAVVTAFSTMIVEAALLGKPSLVVGFGTDVADSGRLIQHARYEHSINLLATPGVTLCGDLDQLEREIRRVAAGEYEACADALRARADAIARNRDGRARARIVDALELIAAEPRGATA